MVQYGPDVTEKDIMENMNDLKEKLPELKYLQIDDGYQAYMGDWLNCCDKFVDMEKLCARIKNEGFEPAIWVAPFIAEADSEVFREHPDWFVKDENGAPLSSADVSFGGWRRGPWYMLDGTHPEAQAWLRHVFHVMREEWGCKYFKLDANMWGALPFGYRYDSEATAVEAYRRGMKAVREGAGPDSFLLGCNAPMWPSIGEVHGMRVTNDIYPNWDDIRGVSRSGFLRCWQNNRLWINDPDCIILEGSQNDVPGPDGTIRQEFERVPKEESEFHAAYILVMGGMVLSGDRIANIGDEHLAMIRKILEETGTAAAFEDPDCRVGRICKADKEILCLFNPTEEPLELGVDLEEEVRLEDYWTGKEEGMHKGRYMIQIAPHHARVLLQKR